MTKRLLSSSLALALALTVGCKKDDKKAEKKPDKPQTKNPEEKPPEPPPEEKPADAAYKVVKPDELTWNPMDPKQPDGAKIAVVAGNPMEDGLTAFFIKVPAGGGPPIHTHTSSYHAVVLSGGVQHWLPGDKKVKSLEPGSYWYQPGGQPHGDKCEGKEDCMAFVVFDGKLDFTPSDAKETKDRGDYKLVPSEKAEYKPLDPEGKGPKLAVVWGDPKTGPVMFGIEFAPGMETPIHKHTSDYHAVVFEGTHAHWGDGEEAPAEGAPTGTYLYQRGGDFHGDACRGENKCRAMVFMPKQLDMTPKEGGGGDDAKDDGGDDADDADDKDGDDAE